MSVVDTVGDGKSFSLTCPEPDEIERESRILKEGIYLNILAGNNRIGHVVLMYPRFHDRHND